MYIDGKMAERMNIVLTTRRLKIEMHRTESNSVCWDSAKYSIPCVKCTSPAGRGGGYYLISYFITLVIVIIHFIYAETVYMNIVTFCIEKQICGGSWF
jgi:hypothetical protein